MTLSPATLDLAPALVVLPGPRAAVADATGAQPLRAPDARDLFEQWPVLLAHAAMTARRLGVAAPARSARIFDALELFAFVRPGRFCAPSAAGLAQAMGLAEPKGAEAQALALREVCGLLLAELAAAPTPSREEALAVAETLARGGWPWGAACIGALDTLTRRGWIHPRERVVVFNTGAAQKYVEAIRADVPQLDITRPIDWDQLASA